MANLSKADLVQLLDISKEAATRASSILMNHYGNLSLIKNKGRIGDLVTNADLEAEDVILNYLKEETPNISILAEESGSDGIENELKWCIDPLDGTTNFAHKYPFFATSIGLTWNDKPIMGVIAIPFLNEMYWGAPTIGVFCNKEPIKVSSCISISNSLLVTGFAYDRHTRLDNNYAEFCWLTHRSRGVRRGGAAAVDLAFVACGRLDGYWERGLAPWDLAAGVVLVELAGGHISDYRGNPFDINRGRIIATTKGIADELIQELNKVQPLEGKAFGAPDIKSKGN